MNHVINFKNHTTILKNWLHISKIKTTNPEIKYKKYKIITTLLKFFDTFVNIATISSSTHI